MIFGSNVFVRPHLILTCMLMVVILWVSPMINLIFYRLVWILELDGVSMLKGRPEVAAAVVLAVN